MENNFIQNSSQWCLRKVQLLRKTVNWCCWRFTHTFCHCSNILGCTHCFWLFTLWFIDEDASFFHFYHTRTNIRSWRCCSSSKIRTQFSHTSCNITMIFKVMSQYLAAFTQPYSFGGRIKLIICEIRHGPSVTIHEISISCRKKTLDGGPNMSASSEYKI